MWWWTFTMFQEWGQQLHKDGRIDDDDDDDNEKLIFILPNIMQEVPPQDFFASKSSSTPLPKCQQKYQTVQQHRPESFHDGRHDVRIVWKVPHDLHQDSDAVQFVEACPRIGCRRRNDGSNEGRVLRVATHNIRRLLNRSRTNRLKHNFNPLKENELAVKQQWWNLTTFQIFPPRCQTPPFKLALEPRLIRHRVGFVNVNEC